jgi:hypothetical protein
MSRKKQNYSPKGYESADNTKDTFAMIYASMLEHPAFISLTPRQKILYIYCKAQKNRKTRLKPKYEYKDYDLYQDDKYFFMNKALAFKYGLYKPSMGKEFYKDIHTLEQTGFIKCEDKGGGDGKTKSIYSFSDKWKDYKS